VLKYRLSIHQKFSRTRCNRVEITLCLAIKFSVQPPSLCNAGLVVKWGWMIIQLSPSHVALHKGNTHSPLPQPCHNPQPATIQHKLPLLCTDTTHNPKDTCLQNLIFRGSPTDTCRDYHASKSLPFHRMTFPQTYFHRHTQRLQVTIVTHPERGCWVT